MDGVELKRAFGRAVKELRETRGISQEDLAARIGRSVDTLSNIERGVNATRIETAHQIAAALEVRLPDLFAFDAEAEPVKVERRQALAACAELLNRADHATLARLQELIEVGLKLSGKADRE